MQINFTQVLQDSWNFFRNQQKTMLSLVAILFIVQTLSLLVDTPLISDENLTNQASLADSLAQVDAAQFLGTMLFKQLITSFVATWGLATIHQISQKTYRTLGQSATLALRRFIGVILLDLLMVAPMLLGMGEALAALLTKTSPSIMSLIAMIVGVWFFVRLNLSSTHYIATQDNIGQSAKTIWLRGKNLKGPLFIYALLVYFVVPMVIFQLSAFSANNLLAMIVSIVAAVLNIFMLVVTYRFYSLFMKES